MTEAKERSNGNRTAAPERKTWDRPEWPGQVWRAEDVRADLAGFLVTVRGDVEQLIAWIEDGDYEAKDTEEAIEIAQNVASNPAGMRGLSVERYARAMDLRDIGRPDSTRETPGFLYGLYCSPQIGGADNPDGCDSKNEVRLNPFCPVRFAAWCKRRGISTAPDSTLPQMPFADVNVPTVDGSGLALRYPKDSAPAFARPGMVVFLTDCAADYGVIEHLTPDLCLVRLENGTVEPVTWGAVNLQNVKPDPAFIREYRRYGQVA